MPWKLRNLLTKHTSKEERYYKINWLFVQATYHAGRMKGLIVACFLMLHPVDSE